MKKQLFMVCCLVCGIGMAQQNDKQLTDATVQQAKIESHIQFLASDELRGRNTPSPEQRIAARYLISQLRSYGVKPLPEYPDYLQPVQMKVQTKPKEVTVSYQDKAFHYMDNTLLLEGNSFNSEAEAIFLNYGTEEDFAKTEVKGKVVIVRAGLPGEMNPRVWFGKGREKYKLASEKGAVALIELYNNAQLPWKLLTSYFLGESTMLDEGKSDQATLIHIWQHDPEAKEAEGWNTRKTAKVQLKVVNGDLKKITAYNVVGYTAGTDAKLKDEYIIYSAHYDHIGIGKANAEGDTIYNGARDNAVGTVTVLSAAENIARYPTRRSGLFILFTGEEKGLLGSQWFAGHSPIDLKKLVYCFNSDNGGYNTTALATIIGLERTTAAELIKKACQAYGLKATDDPAPEQNLFDRSDNVSFAKKGIPAPTFSLGFTAFDEEIGKYYHQPSDQWDNLDYGYLFKFFSSYVYSCRLIANAPVRPFWKPGDKYYETGMKLYK